MLIIGCDFHTRYQQIAMANDETGELLVERGWPILCEFDSCKGGFFLLTFLSVRTDFHSSFEYLLNYLIDFINIPHYTVLCSPRRTFPVVVSAVLPYCRLKTVD